MEAGINYMVHFNPSHDLKSVGFTYSTRFNFSEKTNSSFSVGLPLSIGFSDLRDPRFAMIDLPAEVSYNFGAGSSPKSKKKFGFFVGAGYGVHVTVV